MWQKEQVKTGGWVVEVEPAGYPGYMRLILCTPYGPVNEINMDVPTRIARGLARALYWEDRAYFEQWAGPAGKAAVWWSPPSLRLEWSLNGEQFYVELLLDWQEKGKLAALILNHLAELDEAEVESTGGSG